MNGLIYLFKTMTKIPMPMMKDRNDDVLGKSMKFFPIVGMVIGIILLLFGYLPQIIKIPYGSPVLVVIIVIVEIVLTGGMHLDALASTFDSIFKYRSKQKMLDNMKEIKDGKGIGASGCLILITIILFKVVLLSDVMFRPEGRYSSMFIILVMPVIGRLNCLVNCGTIKGAKSTGLGRIFSDNTKGVDVIIGLILSVVYIVAVIFYLDISILALVIVPITLVLGFLFGKWMEIRIGGVTGETLGALIELTEVVTILVWLIISRC